MILIISNPTDKATKRVLNWLRFYGENVRVICTNHDLELLIKKYPLFKLKLNIDSIWLRKYPSFCSSSENPQVNRQISEEVARILQFISDLDVPKLGNSLFDVNKLTILNCAADVGLAIPDSIVCCTKREVLDFCKNHKRIITKPIAEVTNISVNNGIFSQFTKSFKKEDIESDFPAFFFPSLFQQLIPQEYELRIFYIRPNFYSTAIFCHDYDILTPDWRKNPNAVSMAKYKLPTDIKKRLNKLLNDLKIDTCSIDMIKDINGNYYFLEINPTGQYDYFDTACNFNLDKRIADYLISIKT